MQRQVEDTRHSGVGVKARELRVWAPKSNSIMSQFCLSPQNQEVYHTKLDVLKPRKFTHSFLPYPAKLKSF